MGNNTLTNRFLKIGSYNVRYIQEGMGEPVFLVHGLGASLEWWDMTIPYLAKKFCVYAIDLPGFGLSDPISEQLTPSFFSIFIKNVLDELGIQKTILIGHSMGGYVVLKTAIDNVERVKKLVLVSSAGFGKIENPILKILAIPVLGEIIAVKKKCGVKIYIDSIMYDKKKVTMERLDTAYQYFIRPKAKQTFIKIIREKKSISQPSGALFSTDELDKLDMPILLIWGKQDNLFPLSQGEQANKKLKNSRLVIFDKCGHVPQVEHTIEFNSLLNQFLTSI